MSLICAGCTNVGVTLSKLNLKNFDDSYYNDLYYSNYYIYESHKYSLILLKPNQINRHFRSYRLNEWGKEQMRKQTFDRVKKTLAVLLVVLFIATLTAASVSAKTEKVDVKDFAYKPASLKINADDTVKWTNRDFVDHSVTGPTFNSGMIHKGKSFMFTFTTPGVYNYHDSIHPEMKGTVTVTEKKGFLGI